MSYFVFFGFSSGLAKSMRVPKGTYASIMDHVERVEMILGLEREQYLQNPVHWKRSDIPLSFNPAPDRALYDGDMLLFGDGQNEYAWSHPSAGLFDDLVCCTVEWHNRWVRRLYNDLETWSDKPPKDFERLTVAKAKKFWHALRELTVPVDRWTRSYYRARMDSAYEVMRGRESEGVSFDEDPLTQRQAAAVINLFAQWLPDHDLTLDVPRDLDGEGYDYLASSYDGGLQYCAKCGPMHPDVWSGCPKKRECPIISELCEEDQAEICGDGDENEEKD